jgi:hypothetical protein
MPEHTKNDGRTSRRSFLGAAVGSLLLGSSCVPPAPGFTSPPTTAATLTSQTPFYIAHRGGGDNWPEMTAYAYEQATQLPFVHAIEVSVCLSADGVLVCSHDPTTERLTDIPYVIAEESWETLAPLLVSAKETMNPEQEPRPFTRFDDIVDRYMSDFVIFVEPKVPEAVDPLMAKMVALGQPERVVWKQPINQPHFGRAKRAGFTTWGYVLNEAGHLGENLENYAGSTEIDFLGVQRSREESFIARVSTAAYRKGKDTIIWPIRDADDRARGLRLGCEGMMTSNIAQVPTIPL